MNFNKVFTKNNLPATIALLFFVFTTIVKPKGNNSVHFIISIITVTILYVGLRYIYKKIKKSPSHIYSILFTLLIIFISLIPVLRNEGWPYNHEWLGWRSRIICYVFHFQQYDFIPWWSSGDAGGMGAPLPLYYHKLFNYVAASLFILTGKMKLSTVLSIFIFDIVGVYGMYKTMKLLKVSHYLALFLSLTLIFQYYTVTDWFIRAAFAEYTALCLVPWIFYWIFKLLLTGKFHYSIIPIMILIYMGHNIIAYFSLFLLLIAIVFYLIFNPDKSNVWYILKRSGISAIVFFAVLSIYFIPMLIISDYYDPGKIKLNILSFFVPFRKYIYDANYLWGKTWEGFTVEFSPVMFTFLFVMAFVTIYQNKKIFSRITNLQNHKQKQIIAFLIIAGIFYYFLQLKSSYFFYKFIPGADFIQFPWRLLTIIQVINIILLAYFINRFIGDHNKLTKNLIAILFLACIIFTYPIFVKTSSGWQWFTKEEVEKRVNEGVFGMGEYAPVVKGVKNDNYNYFIDLAHRGIEISDTSKCIIHPVVIDNPEQLKLSFKIQCKEKTLVHLPYNYSGLERMYILRKKSKEKIFYSRSETDPRITIDLPPGNYTLELILPNVFNLLPF